MWPNFVNIFTLSVACILVFILQILPAKTNTRNAYLLLLLLALIIHLIGEQLYLLEIITVLEFSYIVLSMVVLFGPSLYYYTRKFYGLSTNNFLKHSLPLVFGMWFILYNNNSIPQWILSSYYASILLIYFIATVRLKPVLTLKKDQAWMKTIGIGFGILVLLHLIEVIWINADIPSALTTIRICTATQNLFSLLFLLVVIRQIITNPGTFSKAKIRIPYESTLPSENNSEIEILKSFVIEKKAYKNTDLTRKMVTEETGLSIHQISEIINSEFKKNFSDWINDFRINDAKELLKDTHMPIKDIYFEVGFNSKSAFNYAFKKRTNTTPSQFRKGDA